jgi:hypothetical protein
MRTGDQLPESLPTLVKRLIDLAEAEQRILEAISEAVRRNDREEVFRLAAQLTGIDPENGITTLHPKPQQNHKGPKPHEKKT